jgi:hypothetical protein
MKRICAVLAMTVITCATLWAEDGLPYIKVSATATVTNTTLPAHTKTVLMINDGTNEVYFSLYNDAETPADATTSSKELKSGESLTFVFSPNSAESAAGGTYYKTLSIICAAAETATVRVFSK